MKDGMVHLPGRFTTCAVSSKLERTVRSEVQYLMSMHGPAAVCERPCTLRIAYIASKMSKQYQQGRNWTSNGDGSFSNGAGKAIAHAPSYFAAVAENRHGYNSGYSNGHGKEISNPTAYYAAVGEHACRRLYQAHHFKSSL